MATLQKFKILATQCATVAGSPSRSPTTSPVFQLRRRKTLRMLFTRSNGNGNGNGGGRQLGFREESIEDRRRRNVTDPRPSQKNKNNNLLTSSNKLKDLFVSSPSPPPPPTPSDNGKQRGIVRDNGEEMMIDDRRSGGGVIGFSSPRPLFSTFRYRFHRRSWRPVLVTITE